MRKIYHYRGVNCADKVLTLNQGKVKIKVTFENGNVLRNIPAMCVTDNPLAQLAIERCGLFGTTIKLHKTYGEESKEVKPKAGGRGRSKNSDDGKGAKAVVEVTSINDAIEYFEKEGVDVSTISTPEEIAALKKKFNVEFPNLV